MSEPNERDTKFIKSAQSLMDKFFELRVDYIESISKWDTEERAVFEKIIAHDFYDLVKWTIGSLSSYDYDVCTDPSQLMDRIDDPLQG